MSHSQDEREKDRIKASLKSWWSNFTRSGKGSTSGAGPSTLPATASGAGPSGVKERRPVNAVFGEPLRKSLKYASVAISMAGEDGNQYVWGYVPIIVAKTGLFLKENATEVEGVFRIAGSQKRMRELQDIFDTAPRYGKHLTWGKYSVHDAASVLRRYLNQMPEPIVPLDLYNEFRNIRARKPNDDAAAIRTYRLLIASMPPANRYLLLYVLDLLAVFARKSEINRMPASNLAVIFQPGIFSHPSHLQDPEEHKMAVEVLQFLIEHQDNFVLAVSPPPPTNIERAGLTDVSRARQTITPDVAELSDSDEELGELTVHEGGGAKLARRSTSGSAQGKRRGLFRSRRPPARPTSQQGREEEKENIDAGAGAGVVEDLGQGRNREPITAKGEIREVGITSAGNDNQPLSNKAAGVRRSKTVPSRKTQSLDVPRSVSASKGKGSATTDILREGTEEVPKSETVTANPSAEVSKVEADEKKNGGKEQDAPVSDLPTPPPSKRLDQEVPPTTASADPAEGTTADSAA